MNLIKPKKLQSGDTIAIIAPSGPVSKEKIKVAKKFFEDLGYRVKLGEHIFDKLNYLAGEDEDRVSDLHNAFLDKDVKAVICARGGYGAIRIINKIDYSILNNNPKIFGGFSDVTALSLMILKNSSLITYSSPMAQSDFSDDKVNEFTKMSFFNTLCGEDLNIKPENKFVYRSGTANGLLWGGNLSTIVSLCGVDFIPDEKIIFFSEDLNEPAYKLDRYFRQLLNIEKFKNNLSAILLGDFLDVDNPQYLDDFFKELAKELEIPIIAGYPFSHDEEKATVPVGQFVKLIEDGSIIAFNHN